MWECEQERNFTGPLKKWPLLNDWSLGRAKNREWRGKRKVFKTDEHSIKHTLRECDKVKTTAEGICYNTAGRFECTSWPTNSFFFVHSICNLCPKWPTLINWCSGNSARQTHKFETKFVARMNKINGFTAQSVVTFSFFSLFVFYSYKEVLVILQE